MLRALNKRAPCATFTPWLAVSLLAGCAVQPPVAGPAPAEPAAAEVVEVPPAPAPAPEPVVETVAEPPGEMADIPPPPAPTWKRDDVLWIQQRLLDLGYYDGAVDGAVGPGTRKAIREYQKDQDVTADGQPSSALREFMWRNGG
ncbi:MAG: peptidoglycan-binding domain-containing protein [Gammaproteobacteria bacterium]|jgi:peptidoglycan hydrolase-like protein with peptidoglycan-binding domain|nr:peptidoglycan-binding domain-containing protein [Gammaproteobacteria bacterium]